LGTSDAEAGSAWTASDHYWNLKHKMGAGLVLEEL
jgi:hypothetical protein